MISEALKPQPANSLEKGKPSNAIYLIVGLYSALTAFTSFLLPIYLKNNLHFSGRQIGALFAAFSVTSLVTMIPAGVGNDRINSRKLITPALLIVAATFLAMSESLTFISFILLFVSFGVGSNLFKYSGEAYIFKATEQAAKTRELGFYHAVRMGALVVGIVGHGYLLDRITYPQLMFSFGALVFVFAFSGLLIPEVEVIKSEIKQYSREVAALPVVIFLVWQFVFAHHWGAEQVCAGLFIKERLGLNFYHTSLYLIGEWSLVAGSAYFAGRYYPKGRGVYALAIFGLLCSGIGQILMVNDNVVVSYVWRSAHGIGDGVLMVVVYATVSTMFSKERIGGLNSFVGFVSMSGMLVGSLLYGYASELYGPGWPLVVSGWIICGLVPVTAVLYKLKSVKVFAV